MTDAPTGPEAEPAGPEAVPAAELDANDPAPRFVHTVRGRQWIAIGVVVVVAALVFALVPSPDTGPSVAAGTTGSGERFVPTQREPAGTTGDNPFTTSVASATPTASTVPAATVPPSAVATSGLTTQDGSTPGLYGGTRNVASCDTALLVSFLQANPALARAFASVEGIAAAGIPEYVAGLTAVLLRADTAVTNHGFENGVATPLQAVLQAGTAVLVDRYGIPRVRCFCGNPLLPPAPISQPSYTGPSWQGFDPGAVVTVAPAPAPITVIVLVDVNTGQSFGRTPGSGAKDSDPPPTSTTTTTTPATTLPAGRDPSGTYAITQSKASFSGSEVGRKGIREYCENLVPPGGKTANVEIRVSGRSIAIIDAGNVAGEIAINGTYDPATGKFSGSRPLPPPTATTTATQTMEGTIDAAGKLTGTLANVIDPGASTCTFPVTGTKV